MKSFFVFALGALIVGSLIPVQAASNAALSQNINSVAGSALVLFSIALLSICGVLLLNSDMRPDLKTLGQAPYYAYLGGFIVATYVLSITWLAPRMGIGNAICFIVTGQILAAVTIDHFGLMGALVHPISWQRVAGVALMIGGLFLAKSAKTV